eukprot:g3520.t1
MESDAKPFRSLSKSSFLADADESKDIGQPKYMRKVKDLHTQLQSTVKNLAEKIGGVLEEREKDFLTAYRHHMYNVQKELQEAKQKVKEAENAIKNNNQIRKLKQERDWYRTEAIRLDNSVGSLQQTLKEKEDTISELREDQKWLERQLKNSRKELKILRMELDAQGHHPHSPGGSDDGGSSPSRSRLSSPTGSLPRIRDSKKMSKRR